MSVWKKLPRFVQRVLLCVFCAACGVPALAQNPVFFEDFSTDGDGTRYTMLGRGSDGSPDAWEHTFAAVQSEAFPLGPGGEITLAAPRLAIPWHSTMGNATAEAVPFLDSAIDWATGGGSNLNIAFLVQDETSNLGPGDTAALQRMNDTLGHTVNLFSATSVTTEAVGISDLLMISDSVNLGNIYKSINVRRVDVPIINYHPSLTDDLLLTASDGSTQQLQSMNIRAPSSSALPSGLTQGQLIQLSDAKNAMPEYGQPRAGVSTLATYRGPFARSVNSLAVLDAMVAGTAGSMVSMGVIDVADMEDIDDGPGEDIWPFNLPIPGSVEGGEDDNFGFLATGKLNVTRAGDFVFAMAGEDGGRLRINGNDVITVDNGGFSYQTSTVNLTTGEHDIEWAGRAGGGDAGFEISVTPADFFNGSVDPLDFEALSIDEFEGIALKEPGLEVSAYYLDVASSPDVETDRPAMLAAPTGTKFNLPSAPFRRAKGDYLIGTDMDSIPGQSTPPGLVEFTGIDLTGVANPKLTMNVAATFGMDAGQDGVLVLVNDEEIARIEPNSLGIMVNDSDGTLLTPDFRSLTWDLPQGLTSANIVIEVSNNGSGEAIGIDEILITDGDPDPSLLLGPPLPPENRIQQGLNGYAGLEDTEIRFSQPDADLSGKTSLNPDGQDGGGAVQVLMRFNDLMGDGENQIPTDANIEKATLNINITGPGTPLSLHRMLQTWEDDTANWNAFTAGVQADDVEAKAQADDLQSANAGITTWDVTESIRAWQADPDSNFGWVIVPTGTNGADFLSAETFDLELDGVPLSELGLNVAPFIEFFLGSALIGDCNGDGILNADDLACVATIEERDAVLTALNTLAGDLNGDGQVDFPDFLVMSANFGTDLTSYTDGNVDLQDGIAFADFLILSANFGNTVNAAAVPEPTGLALGLLALVGLALRRRRPR